MGVKRINTRNAGTMTEAEFFGKIRSALRKAFSYWQPMQEAKRRAKRPSQSDNKRLKFEYQCATCSDWFPDKETRIDHINPCGELKSLEDIAEFVRRLASEDPNDYQIVCVKCHQIKTNAENDARRELRKIRSSE